jgi:hypothetical protein
MMVHNWTCFGLQLHAEDGIAEVATVQQLDDLSYAVRHARIFHARYAARGASTSDDHMSRRIWAVYSIGSHSY